MRLLLASMFVLGVAGHAWGQCLTASPGAGWVCQNGGWLPPGHPALSPPQGSAPIPPTIVSQGIPVNHEDNDWILDRVLSGRELPDGVVWFTPPLVIYDMPTFAGVTSRTILKPTTTAPGNLVYVISNMPGEAETGYPRTMVLRDFRLDCLNHQQTGIVVHGAAMQFQRVVVTGCGTNVWFDWVVNVAFRDSRFVKGGNGWVVPVGATATTLRCSGCQFSYNTVNAIFTGTVQGLILDDSTILEYNPGYGLHVGCGSRVTVRDVWFETNGTSLFDPCHGARLEGGSSVR